MPIPDRPLSPHIQVYKPQFSSLLSITHRLAGLALSAGSIVFVWQLLAAAAGPESFGRFQSFLGSWLGIWLLIAWTLAFFYHLANGIRHLVWDAGYAYDLPSTYRSGAAVLVATVILTLAAWAAALAIWRVQ